jgi:hypothetical protein
MLLEKYRTNIDELEKVLGDFWKTNKMTNQKFAKSTFV